MKSNACIRIVHSISILSLCVLLLAMSLKSVRADSTWVYAVQISAVVQPNPPKITLNWEPDMYGAVSYAVSRKSKEAIEWGPATLLSGSATNYTDTNVAIGLTYEYQIYKVATLGYTGFGYIYTGINAPLTENRGTVLLIVATNCTMSLSNELSRLQTDLVGDGWKVLRHDVSSNDTPANVKGVITNDYFADPVNVKSVFLFGHVPILQSGELDYDGHYTRPMPADAYYGDMKGDWSSSPSYLPADVTLMVGRVDLFNMPGVGALVPWPSEVELLRNYLNKDHNWRHKLINVSRLAIVGDRRGSDDGDEADAADGFRNFEPFVGPGNTLQANVQSDAPIDEIWMPMLAAGNYLWAYGCGGGEVDGMSGLGTNGEYNFVLSTDIVGQDAHAVFVMMFGSYFGNWDAPDDIMRSVLATPTMGLTCCMAGRPHWFVHHMGLGETIGYGARLTMNNTTLYQMMSNGFPRAVYIALMGDPTLRMDAVAPISGLSANTDASGTELSWAASPDAVLGYHVYRAPTVAGPFSLLTDSLVTRTNFTDARGSSGAFSYMVRAVKLQTTPSGSYSNLSQGIFVSPAALRVEIEGGGSVSPNDNGRRLQIGQNYSMTATAAPGFAFACWTNAAGTVLTTSWQLNFTMESNLTLIATFVDVTPPTVAVTPPAQEVTVPGLLLRGTARDNVGVADVICQLNAGSWNPVSSENGFTNWTTNLMLAVGANLIRFYSMDLAGNLSKTSSVSVFYVTTTPLTLGVNGSGKIARGFNGNLLVVGKPYTVTGVPGVNNLFSNWSGIVQGGSVTFAGNPLTFLMQSNMVLTANFVTNNFLQAAGEYNGLFYVTATGATEETAGLLNHLTVSPLGAYSGQLSIGGQNYSVSGGFNVAGLASLSVAQIDRRGPLLLEMALNLNTVPCQLTGSVSGTNGSLWTAGLVAVMASDNLQSGEYTILIPPQTHDADSAEGNSPPGFGYAAITNHNGVVTLSGALADGTPFNQTVAVSQAGDLPVYASLYNHAGLLLGWINLANGSPAGNVAWIRESSTTSPAYPNGFTNSIQVLRSPWTNPPPGVAAIAMPNGQLNISGANQLPPQLSFDVHVNTRNALVKMADTSPPNSLTGSINPKNGVLTVVFGNATGRTTTRGVGAVLQNTTNAGGFFVGQTNAGSMTLAAGLP